MSTSNRLTCKYNSLRGNYRTFQCKARFLLGLTKGYHLFLTGPILRPLIKKDGDMHIEYHGTNLIHSLISNILLLFLLTTYLSRHQHTPLCGNYENKGLSERKSNIKNLSRQMLRRLNRPQCSVSAIRLFLPKNKTSLRPIPAATWSCLMHVHTHLLHAVLTNTIDWHLLNTVQ